MRDRAGLSEAALVPEYCTLPSMWKALLQQSSSSGPGRITTVVVVRAPAFAAAVLQASHGWVIQFVHEGPAEAVMTSMACNVSPIVKFGTLL